MHLHEEINLVAPGAEAVVQRRGKIRSGLSIRAERVTWRVVVRLARASLRVDVARIAYE